MSAAQLLVLGLACPAAVLIALGLLWLDWHLDDLEEEEREAFHDWTKGRRA